MKIVSRPEDYAVGDGAYTLKLDIEELQLISSLLYIIRLGNDVYEEAAFSLVNKVEELFDEDFIEDSSNAVSPLFSILDHNDNIIEQHPSVNICIEV